ncbi:MAG: response regulator, partial [Pseudomonadota bacterium]|nr:response regulator [Pseudomonadota bacterium]
MAAPSVLIVDDEAFMRRVIRQTLTSLGCSQVSDVGSVAEALALLGKNKFDLILSDIYMPGMSGLDFLKSIRTGKTSLARDSRIIALTSFSNTEILNTSMMLDVNGFMVKPIKSDLVKKNMLKALKEKMYLRTEAEYEAIAIDGSWASREEAKPISVGGAAHLSLAVPDAAPVVVKEPEEPGAMPGVTLVPLHQIPVNAVLAE